MRRVLSLILSASLCFVLLTACGDSPTVESPSPSVTPTQAATPNPTPPVESPVVIDPVDYADTLELDMTSETIKQEVTVKTFIDGDTTHFFVPDEVMANGVLKARYLAVNTPESTGKIEEYGKSASKFTREKLSAATSIIIESEHTSWDPDSTGDRYLVWVWYKTDEMSDYRNLNVEIL